MRAIFLILLGLLVGCGRDVATPFTEPAGQMNQLPATDVKSGKGAFCAPASDGTYPGKTTVISVEKQESTYSLGVGGGCVLRPLREVWAVTHNKVALTSSGAKLLGFEALPPQTAQFRFQGKFEAGPPLFVQNWTTEWKHSLKEGDLASPKRVLIEYQKVFGTSFIKHWKGEIELVELRPGVTSFAMRNEIEAARTGPKEAADTVRDLLEFVRTKAPVWDYLNASKT